MRSFALVVRVETRVAVGPSFVASMVSLAWKVFPERPRLSQFAVESVAQSRGCAARGILGFASPSTCMACFPWCPSAHKNFPDLRKSLGNF
jgi:hypothetical protein